MAADQDAVFSFEGAVQTEAKSGIGAAYPTVQGKASRAGAKPRAGAQAELDRLQERHQLQCDPRRCHGPRWQSRVQGVGFNALKRELQIRVQKKLLPDAKVTR